MNTTETRIYINELSEAASEYLSKREEVYTKEPRYFTRVEATDYLGVNAKTVDKYVNQLGIDPKRFDDAAWLVSIDEIYRVRDKLREEKLIHDSKFVRGNRKLMVLAVQNQKGGVGKTVSATTIASGLATEFHDEFRVGLIDLDPQRTATSYYPPSEYNEEGNMVPCPDYWSAGDLLKGNYELEEGESYEQFVSDCFLSTTIPNLRILPASQSDRGVEAEFHSKLAKGTLKKPYMILQDIINAVEDEFDIIIIDTPPSMTFATINAYTAATSVLFPMQLDQNDIDATCGYLQFLDEVWTICEDNNHPGYDFMKILYTNVKAQSNASTLLDNEFSKYFSNYISSTQFNNSEAIKECSRLLSTVFDISKSEYSGKTKAPFQHAKTNAFTVVSGVYKEFNAIWTKGSGK
ncbi:AAA family ATPase [Vibrio sp. 1159]|uniref:AAA family ATPase n=1 Tax=Vibrio sp. 1159 TaxID=3074545 RepID=UPI002963FE91|nr:AAA family ATPase [Vibrio sp. 1159]MDW2320167.1 AAA family ATPase [Vibrio sp. 1159]